MWWSDRKMEFYTRAARRSSFHSELAAMLPIPPGAECAELGCGLGFLTDALRVRGVKIKGYDNDEALLERAKSLFPSTAFSLADCYTLPCVADISLCCFFGRIGEGDNLERLMATCKKKLVYIRKKPGEEKHSLSGSSTYRYEARSALLRFDQPLKDQAEAREYLSLWPKEDVVIEEGDDEYPLLLKKEKQLEIITIYKGEER